MGNAAGQGADGLYFLRLVEPSLKADSFLCGLFLFGDIPNNADNERLTVFIGVEGFFGKDRMLVPLGVGEGLLVDVLQAGGQNKFIHFLENVGLFFRKIVMIGFSQKLARGNGPLKAHMALLTKTHRCCLSLTNMGSPKLLMISSR